MSSMDLTIDAASIRKAREDTARRVLKAGTEAIREGTRDLELDLEDLIRGAVPGGLFRALKSITYPEKGIARDPVGRVFLGKAGPRTRGAFQFFTEPGRITSKSGDYLAIPLPAAGVQGRSRNLTPGEWQRRTGRLLEFVWRPGRASLLVAKGVLNGRTNTFRPITRQRTAADERRGFQRKETTIPIFVLIPSAAFANRVAIQPRIDAAGAALPGRIFRKLQEYY